MFVLVPGASLALHGDACYLPTSAGQPWVLYNSPGEEYGFVVTEERIPAGHLSAGWLLASFPQVITEALKSKFNIRFPFKMS